MIFLNRFFFPDHSATSQMLGDLAFALARNGERVVVITSRQRYDAPDARLPACEEVEGVEIHRVWTSRFGRDLLLGRMVDYLTFYVCAAWTLWRMARRGEVVVAKTDPPLLSLVAGPVARLRGAILVNWLQDMFPEVAMELGVGRGRLARLGHGLLRRLRDRSLRRAALNVAIGRRMARRLHALGVPEQRIAVIPNWADGSFICPIRPEDNPLRAQWKRDGALVVGYAGNLGRAYEYEAILDAIVLLEQEAAAHARAPSILWLFVGGGSQYEALRGAVRARELTSVRFEPYQPRARLAQSLSVPDVHLVTLPPALEGLIVPSKFYGIAAAGRPTVFIGDRAGEIALELERHGCGVTVAHGDGAGLARVLLDLAAQPDLRARMGARAREAFLCHYDKTQAVERWQQHLVALKSRARP